MTRARWRQHRCPCAGASGPVFYNETRRDSRPSENQKSDGNEQQTDQRWFYRKYGYDHVKSARHAAVLDCRGYTHRDTLYSTSKS